MSIASLFRRPADKIAARRTYGTVVAQSRAPQFYAGHGVPDTLDGRFEMIALHVFLVLHRLRAEEGSRRFGQALYDVFFSDMDRGLRELGTGDLSVGKQVKLMAQALYGRITAYQDLIAGENDGGEALRRNLFGTVAEPAPDDIAFMTAYLKAQAACLAGQPTAAIASGTVSFLPIAEVVLS